MTPTDWLIVVPLALLVVSWLVGDFLIAAHYRPRFGVPTITARVQELSRRYIALPFVTGLVLGLVCGHLFGQF